MPAVDLAELRSVIDPFVPLGRSGLLPALHAAQSLYGWLPEAVCAEVARALNVPLADVHGVIEFYSMFYPEPVGQTIVRLCTDPACSLRGAEAVLDAACRKAGISAPGETSADGAYTVERSPCLGMCNTGVAANVTYRRDGRYHNRSFGHVRAYTPALISAELALAGFEVKESFLLYSSFEHTFAGWMKRVAVDLGRRLLKLGQTVPLGMVVVARQGPGGG